MNALSTKSTPSTPSTLSEQDAKTLRELHTDFQKGLVRGVALGTFCIGLKRQLPHGMFQSSLEQAVPEINYRTLARCMEVANGFFATKAIDLDDFFAKVTLCHFSHGGEIFLLPESEVPAELKPVRKAADEMFQGKSRREVVIQIKSKESKGGFHPNNQVVLDWLKANHPEIHKSYSSQKSHQSIYPWLLEHHPAIAAAYRKQHKAAPIPADLLLAAKRDRFQRMLKTVAESLDEKEYAPQPADLRRQAQDLFRDYYKALSASLKGAKKKGQGK